MTQTRVTAHVLAFVLLVGIAGWLGAVAPAFAQEGESTATLSRTPSETSEATPTKTPASPKNTATGDPSTPTLTETPVATATEAPSPAASPTAEDLPTVEITPNPVIFPAALAQMRILQAQEADLEDRLIASGEANQVWPDAAYDPTNGQYLIVWTDDTGSGSVRGRFLSRLGATGGLEFTISNSLIGQPYRPSIAANLTDGSYLILWSELNGGVFVDGVFNLSTYNLYALAVDSAGAPLEGSPTLVTTELTFYPVPFAGYDVAYNSAANEYFVVWQQPPGIVLGGTIQPHHVEGRKLTATGLVSGSEVSFANGSVGSIAVAYSSQSNEYLYTFDRFTASWLYDLYGQRLHADTLAPAGPIFNTQGMLAQRDQYDANIAYSPASNLYLITYGDVPLVVGPNDLHVRGRFVEAGTGTLAPYTFPILPSTVWDPGPVWNGGVTYSPVDQRFLATGWTPGSQLLARLIADGGTPIGDLFSVTQLPAAYGAHVAARLDGLEEYGRWLVTWNTASDVYVRFASPQGTNLMGLLPANWDMVLSLRPTFRWVDPGPVDSYVLRVYLATGNPDQPTAGLLVQESTLDPMSVDCDGMECRFKPGIPRGNPAEDEFELTSLLVEVADPFNRFDPATQSPEDSNLLGYLWELEVHSGTDVTRSETALFQIPPLGLWSVAETSSVGPCNPTDYRRESCVDYNGGYWNYYDDNFYRWGEIFDVPPQLLKAIAYGESGSALGPHELRDGSRLPPTRAYLYEAGLDYGAYQSGVVRSSWEGYQVREGYAPDPMPNNSTIPDGSSIYDLVYSIGLGYEGALEGIPGCSPRDFDRAECRANAGMEADYSIFASYGFGQVEFSSNWSMIEAVNGGQLPPPENMYEADQGARASAAVLGLLKRCVTIGSGYPNADDGFEPWRPAVGSYGVADKVNRVRDRLAVTSPMSPFNRGNLIYEQQGWPQVEAIVGLAVDAGCSFYPQTGAAVRAALNAYLAEVGVSARESAQPALASLSPRHIASPPASPVELDRVSLDFNADGNPETVSLQLRVPSGGSSPGRIVVLDGGDPSIVLWESPPVSPNFMSDAFAHVLRNEATGRIAVLIQWGETLHGYRTYLLELGPSGYRLIPIRGEDGNELDGVFADGEGAFLATDGSLLVSLSTERFQSTLIEVYTYENEGYEFARSYIHDWSIPDTTPPTTVVEPGPVGGWLQPPVHVRLTANDEGQGVAGINYRLMNATGETATGSPPLDVVEFDLGEGHWMVFYDAVDLAGNHEFPDPPGPVPVPYRIDGTAPTTEAVLEGEQGPDGAFRSAVTVELLATEAVLEDGSPGSGVAGIEYSLDGGATWLEYTAPLLVEGSGVHEVLHRASDAAGNLGTQVTTAFEIVVDGTPPVLTVGAHPQSLWPPNGKEVAVTIEIEAADAESGLVRLTVWIEDEYVQHEPSVPPIMLGGEANVQLDLVVRLVASRLGSDKDGRIYRILVEAEDMAGNVSIASAMVLVSHDQGKSQKK
jgi:hypothetical protein